MNANPVPLIASLLGILISLAGAVVAGVYLRRSRWALLLLGAFALQVVLQVAGRFILPLFFKDAETIIGYLFVDLTVISILGFVAQSALVIGIAGVLSELRSPSPNVQPDARYP